MKKEELKVLCMVYKTIQDLEDIVKKLLGDMENYSLGVGVIGTIGLLEKLILDNSIAELRNDCIADTHCSALYVLYDSQLTSEEQVEYLLGEKSIENYRYKIY